MTHDPNKSWFNERIQREGGVIVKPVNEDEVIEFLTNDTHYPSPIRPVGSRHSMTPCISAQAPGTGATTGWGTIVDMTGLTTLREGKGGLGSLKVKPEGNGESGIVTIPAGLTFYDVAWELSRKGWMFRVNTELGTLTIGAAACGATKDSSFPGESGQVCHDVIGMRVIRPDGEAVDVGEHDEDLRALRCSYGLFGIVTEVTCRVYRTQYISIRHRGVIPKGNAFTSSELQEHLNAWLGSPNDRNAVFLYLFPYRDRIVAEIRQKPHEPNVAAREKSAGLQVRNEFWHRFSHDIEQGARDIEKAALGIEEMKRLAGAMFGINVTVPAFGDLARRMLEDAFGAALTEFLTHTLTIPSVNPVAQIVNFNPCDEQHRFTFSMWAFPEAKFADILPDYFALCEKHEKTYRSGLPHASYHIGQDTTSVLSYSYDGPVWTLDPICPANVPGWEPFLKEFNKFCSVRGGVPLLNQTPHLTRAQVALAFGKRLTEYKVFRERYDPKGRMLNAYFAEILGVELPTPKTA